MAAVGFDLEEDVSFDLGFEIDAFAPAPSPCLLWLYKELCKELCDESP